MEQELPADASSLIYLAKADAFQDVALCVQTIHVPPAVWHESVEEGERIGAPEVQHIRDALVAGSLNRVELSAAQSRLAVTIATENRIGRGESEVLALARPGAQVLIDEGRASRVARILGIVPLPTLFLPVVGHRAGDLAFEEAFDLLRRLGTVTGVRSDVALAIEQELRKEAR
jgi:predicted nucleic acid-binding protein